MRTSLLAATLAASLTAAFFPAHAQTTAPVSLLDETFNAIGGRGAWRSLNNIEFVFSRSFTSIGQDEWPGAPDAYSSMDGTELRDYARPGLWTRYRLPNVRFTFTRAFLRDSAGFMADSLSSSFAGGPPREGYASDFHDDPIRLLRALSSADGRQLQLVAAAMRSGRRCDGVRAVLPTDTITIWSDRLTHQPIEIERDQDDPVFGRRETQIRLAGWTKAGELRIPQTIAVNTNDVLTQSVQISQARVNVNADSMFATVRKSASAATILEPRIVELAPNIYRAEASSAGVPYNVLFAQIGDSIVLVDPPIDDRYTATILDSIRGRFPKAPARLFVVTHHHADHLGGARTAFAAGLRAITSSANADYVRAVGHPSAQLAASRRVTMVRDSMAIGTGPGRLVIYEIPNSHARGLIMVYFPDAKLLAEVDLAAGPPQDRRDLYDFLTTRGIQVDRLARMHGSVMTWDQFVKTVPGAPKRG